MGGISTAAGGISTAVGGISTAVGGISTAAATLTGGAVASPDRGGGKVLLFHFFYAQNRMETYQQNKLTMLQAVGLYLENGGASLAAIKRIGAGAKALADVVGRIEEAATKQATPSSGSTRSREEVKAEAGAKAEALRQLIVALSADATLLASVKTPVSKHLTGKDADLLRYLSTIAAGVGTLDPKALADSGYDADVLKTLEADIALLTDTQGATRQIQIGTSGATDALPGLFAEADLVFEKQLDPLVRAQKLAQPEAVKEYDKARRIIHTAARRRPRFGGTVVPGAVALALDRQAAGLPDPILTNRSGKGRELRYYTAATATARPAPNQGVLVKNRAEVHLDTYAKLGPDPDAPYLLVVLEGADGEGHWGVK